VSTTTDTYLLLRAFVDELARCGLRGACTSPGSRSTPLVLSLVRDGRFPCWSHIDERSAAFFALGVAKASGDPVALTCTSGTAAAHYAPAVIEAHEARIPLIVLTADRPPDLRDVGAGQTIDQLRLYGSAAKWFFEVGTHAATPERVRWMRSLACRAYALSIEGRPGPVHLNFPLREPLVLDEPLPDAEPGGGGRPGGRPWARHVVAPPAAAPLDLTAFRRPVIVAGRHERADALAEALPRAATALGAPLLADPLSGARRGTAAVAHYDALLREPAFAAARAPDVVVRVGDLPTSKPLRQWLAGVDAHQIAFDPEGARQDPAAVVAEWRTDDPGAWAHAVAASAPPAGASDWLAGWREADRRAGRALAATLGEELSEPAVAAALADLDPEATVFTASSMPVRDVETFWPVLERPPRVLAHRGANGIDGTVAAAFGAAAAAAGPVVLHLGDVALAHDVGSLLCARRLGLALTIVVVDNAGGGIFDFLPVASQRDAFEEHVATPPGLEVERVAAAFGLAYEAPTGLAGLHAALARATGSAESTIVHVRTERAANVALHRSCWSAVSAALRMD
jgi:2-succinyl-5-enolpyruvyl-6-hydroxy-3-cyclohexene-1-carboxylate synthase